MMADGMRDETLLRSVSKAFNSAMSFKHFSLQLDLEDIDIDAAQIAYSKHLSKLLKYYPEWLTSDVIDFTKIFKRDDFLGIVLPCSFSKTVDPKTFFYRLQLKAIDAQDNTRVVEMSHGLFESIAYAIGSIDAEKEMYIMMMYDISSSCRGIRQRGIGHGAI